MLVLTLRTDKPEAELGLYKDSEQLAYISWPAHRELAETIHLRLRSLLKERKLSLHDLQGLVVFQGPGSFTGLRIGISVANALADSLQVPIVGSSGEDWIKTGLTELAAGQSDTLVIPEYGAAARTTQQKK